MGLFGGGPLAGVALEAGSFGAVVFVVVSFGGMAGESAPQLHAKQNNETQTYVKVQHSQHVCHGTNSGI